MLSGLLLLVLLSVSCVSASSSSLSYKNASSGIIRCMDKERRALLSFRAGLRDSHQMLASWSNTRDCCKWSGVKCSNKTGHVITLDLSYMLLAGKISPSLLELQELTYLDLSSIDFGNRPIPKFIGSFTKLKHLRLFDCNLSGVIPSQLGNLSNLNSLALSSHFDRVSNLFVENVDWLSRLSSLESLYMFGVDLRRATKWVDIIKSLPSLSTLVLFHCQLSKVISPSSFSSINSSSTSITYLELSGNGFTPSLLYSWLFNLTSSLVELHLSDNLLNYADLEAFGDYMHSLQFLDLSVNLLEGMMPISFGNLSNLVHLDMQGNSLSGNLSDSLDILSRSGCASALEYLSLESNKLYGPLPDGIIMFSSLRKLDLSSNQLNGTLSKKLGTLSQLEYLDLSSNSLTGTLSEAHFSNLSRLTHLDLSANALQIKVSPKWYSHFQLAYIRLRSCNLGPLFPNWIRTQKNFYHLDISNNGISDSIPSWLWDHTTQSAYLDLSSNNFGGMLPDLSSKKLHGYPSFDLSSNNFEGPIPLFPSNLTSLKLSRNKFSGTLDFLCQLTDTAFSFLDISHNLLTGGLPDCFVKLKGLVVMNLEHNRLSGKIPSSLGSLSLLETLYLYNNSFSGELPLSLSNCEHLRFLDVGENKLTGNIPAWIGANISQLSFLSLRSNNFIGTIPLDLCQLNELQVLDLSMNNLFGSIPPCLSNLSAMVKSNGTLLLSHEYTLTKCCTDASSILGYYADYSVIGWQGRELEFGNNLRLLKLIDLSSNKLSGEIPDDITKLFELVALNLSRNALHGEIPQQIGQLKSIETLDLSRNRFSGKLPASLSQLDSLGYLDLSYNNFSGKIPSSTQIQSFNASNFIGNVGLCGPPIPSKCPGNDSPQTVVGSDENDEEDEFMKWLYIGMASGFITGFWGICGALLLNRRGRHAFFRFTNDLMDWVYVKIATRKF